MKETVNDALSLTKGYKQTEVGLIPEDWEAILLKEVCKKITDGTHDTPKPISEGVPFLTAIHVKENKIHYQDCYFLAREVHDEIYRRCNPEKNDVLMVNIGAGVGTTALVNVDYEFSLKNVALLKPSNHLEGAYLNHILINTKQKILRDFIAGGAQPFLSLGQISKIKIPLPPTLTEQKAIATALSDVDELIANLDKLITKKKAIKQGAMQQLLTGKTRVKGFEGNGKFKQTEVGLIPEDWGVEPIGKLASISTGGSDTQDRVDDGIYPFYVRSNTIERINKYSFDGEAILTSGDGVGVGKIFHYVNCKFDYHQRVYNIHNYRNDVAGKYLFFQFSTNFYDRVMAMTAKSSVDSVRREMISEMLIPLPPTITEQKAISQILSDMDTEIEQLETKKAKYNNIKQGMMQELLTGKTRLI